MASGKKWGAKGREIFALVKLAGPPRGGSPADRQTTALMALIRLGTFPEDMLDEDQLQVLNALRRQADLAEVRVRRTDPHIPQVKAPA